MFFKCHYHLRSLVGYERHVVDERVEKDMSLDIFKMTSSTSEPTRELVNRELLIFKHYQVDVKDIKCALEWWEKHESLSPTIGFCVKQILGIIGFQIEIERIFSLVGILTSFKRCVYNQKI
jgi:hypothetical protein